MSDERMSEFPALTSSNYLFIGSIAWFSNASAFTKVSSNILQALEKCCWSWDLGLPDLGQEKSVLTIVQVQRRHIVLTIQNMKTKRFVLTLQNNVCTHNLSVPKSFVLNNNNKKESTMYNYYLEYPKKLQIYLRPDIDNVKLSSIPKKFWIKLRAVFKLCCVYIQYVRLGD